MVQYWRAAGMTYLKYSAHCATLVRNAVKESVKEAAKKGKNAKAGEFSMMKAEWEGGKIVTRTQVENVPGATV